METKSQSTLIFYVNGTKVEEHEPDPEMTLLTYLRRKLQLTGSKLACGEGGCGACTVMLSKYSHSSDSVHHYNVNACLYPLCGLHGLAVTTVEGIGTVDNLHPVQERIARFHGSQCGYCTPGFVMSMYTLLRNNNNPSKQEIQEHFDGNLCRCTGYRPILDAFSTFATHKACPRGDQCCQKTKANEDPAESLVPSMKNLKPYDSTRELIFPPDLKVNHGTFWSKPLSFHGPNVQWVQPPTLNDLVLIKHNFPQAKIVIGNTEIGIETKFKGMQYKVLVSPASVTEMSTIKVNDSGVVVGGAVTLAQLKRKLEHLIDSLPGYKTKVFSSIVEMLKWFASNQIRNVASVAGNIMTASPISDLNPLFLAADVSLVVQSHTRGMRTVKMDKEFFKGYRKIAVENDEVLVSLTIPFTEKNEYFNGYKQANRKEDDISIVNAGMMVTLSENNTVNKARLAFGGMGVTTVLAHSTMDGLIGLPWDEELYLKVQELLPLDLPLTPGSPGGVVEYRRALALSFFFKFFMHTKLDTGDKLDSSDLSALSELEHTCPRSMQVFGGTDIREANNSLNKPFPHHAALQQSTGEAVYVDDVPLSQGELFLVLVTSTHAHARIVSVDYTQALECPGVVDCITAADLKGKNEMGVIMDTVFADKVVTSQGQVIAAVVADSQAHAKAAAQKVRVEYEEKPAINTIQDAIRSESYFPKEFGAEVGNLEEGFKASDRIIEGEAHIGGQYHFYFETHAIRVIPWENGEMEVFASTQHPTQVQADVAKGLNVSANKVIVRTKRLGGGFGGKEYQSSIIAVPAAVAAKKLGRPIRVMLDRDEDMVDTGNRHPYWAKYKVGVKLDGTVTCLHAQIYSNAGNSIDLSYAAMQRTIVHLGSAYMYDNMKLEGRCCKTNIMSNTAFRSFGAIQGDFIIESIMDDIAAELNLEAFQVKERNFPKSDDVHYYGMHAGGDIIKRSWNMCKEKSQFFERKQQIDAYNRQNKWKKKGIALTPNKYGIAFLQKHMNQAGALVHIYLDGSVMVNHSGVEMGQGLHTKVIQMASEILNIPVSRIHIMETSTITVPNTSPTAASVNTDSNGYAVKEACDKLNDRLEPFKKMNPSGKWEEWVRAAYMNSVSLSATGFFCSSAGVGGDTMFRYFTYGAACCEVQIDCLTGDHKVLRTDIVMDIGKSINPAIDIGQIEGAFVQGYGLMLLEDIKIRPDGTLLTRGPGNYKIPSVQNLPAEMNVYLVPDSTCPENIFSSRGLNEPPICLSTSAFMAVKEAIRAARRDNTASTRFQLDCPALPDRIRMACQDTISKQFPEADPKSYKPWIVTL